MPENQTKIAEVIEASTVQFTAQCYELYTLPPLGSLVKTGDIYGIVCHAETAGLDTGRKPIARGKDEASEEAVYQSSPQLTKLLRSEFTAAVVGYKNDGKIYQYLPPRPARIHSFVYLCQPNDVREFSRSFGFLNILTNAALPIPADEVIAAALRQMSKAQEDSRAFLVAAGKELANLLSSDFIRLKNILGRLK
jgi:3-hydroxyacyl-CoA dehydrogenase